MRAAAMVGAVIAVCASSVLIVAGPTAPYAAAASATACADYGTDITGHTRGTLSGDKKSLDVVLISDGFRLTAVGVSGGGNLKIYSGGSYTGLTAPPNPGGQIPGISSWFACGVRTAEPTVNPPRSPSPTRSPSPSASPTPTQEPSPTTGPTEAPEATESPEVTESPEATDTPMPTDSPTAPTAPPVPTSIPAGLPSAVKPAPSGVAVVAGLAGAAVAGVAGLFALRHRRPHE